MAVLPSKRDRALATLRDQATALGLQISLKPPPEIPPRLVRCSDTPLVAYFVRVPRSGQNTVAQDLYVRTREGWQSRSSDPVPGALASLPEGAEVVITSEAELRVYWDERGGDDSLNSLLKGLSELHPGLNLPT